MNYPAPRTGSPYGSRAHVACASGEVWAGATCVEVDPLRKAAIFAIRVANNSSVPLNARLAGDDRRLDGCQLSVAPFAIFEAMVPVALRAFERPAGASILVDGPGVALAIPMPAPGALAHAPAAFERWKIAVAIVVALAILAACAALVRLVRVAPQAVRTPVHALVKPVPHPALAPARRPSRRASALEDSPLLDDLTVSPLPARAGTSLKVAYATSATTGDVWLLDLHGQVWAHRSLDSSGTTWLHVPESAAGREMRVVVHAQRGAHHAQMGAGVIVVPDDTYEAGAADAAGGSVVTVEPQAVVSGSPIRVTLAKGHGEALVSLTDASGSVIQEVDAPAGARAVLTLTAPGVSTQGTYDVVVSMARGVSQEEIVRPITVMP